MTFPDVDIRNPLSITQSEILHENHFTAGPGETAAVVDLISSINSANKNRLARYDRNLPPHPLSREGGLLVLLPEEAPPLVPGRPKMSPNPALSAVERDETIWHHL
jgi:hypothetical protein